MWTDFTTLTRFTMKKTIYALIVCATLHASTLLGISPLFAQDIELPEYTTEQRWQRLGTLMVGWQAAMVAFGEAQGMSAEEVGMWVGEFFSKGWLSGREASQMLRSFNRNFMAMPDAFVEVIDTTPTSVTARHNHPIEPFLGPGGRSNGVSGDEISTMLRALDDVIAEWNGVGLEREVQSEYDVLTMKTKYGPIRASDRIRWNRNAYLSWLNWLQLLSMRMESGMTAQEVGAADAEIYGPGWGSQTPWQLYRGMVWNWMTDPDADCETLSASPEEVQARCKQHYREVVEGSQEYHNVTPEDVFESGRAFAVGVADQLGMVWIETLEDGYRMITVTRK